MQRNFIRKKYFVIKLQQNETKVKKRKVIKTNRNGTLLFFGFFL
jgi:hypothetical protein